MVIRDNSANVKIAKNTILLYIRTIVVLFISLYSSRLVLKALGVDDLGIFNIVGGIVSLMAVIQGAQTTTTSRFITYDLGQKASNDTLSRTFSACMTIHLVIAIIIFIIGETFGLYIINHWVNIPVHRIYAANIVYQVALLSFMLNIIRVPYNSVVIAYEEMNVFAIFSIIEVLMKLILIFFILHSDYDHLILYSASIMFVSLCILIGYYIYIKVRHAEYKYNWFWDKKYSYQILSFSGWTLTSSSTNTITQQGVNLLFNNYVGLIANAALGFANQVNAAVGQFISSFTTAFNPQIIKLFSMGDLNNMHKLMNRASKFSFVLAYIFALPLIFNMDFILHLWLTEVPAYTTEFTQLILICSTIDATTGVYNTAITASGKLKKYHLLISCSFILDLIISFILLTFKIHPAIVFCSRILTRGILNMIIGLYFTRVYLNFNLRNYFRDVLLPITLTILITIPVNLCIYHLYDGFIKFFISSFLSLLLIFICSIFIIMDKDERIMIKKRINK